MHRYPQSLAQNFILCPLTQGKYKNLDSSPFNKNLPPFTGHGFTSGKNGTLGVPEWKADYGKNLRLDDGAEMCKVDLTGNETLIGIYDEIKKIFVKL